MTSKSCNKVRRNQAIVLVFTFLSYASLHACRQTFANAKSKMQDEWGLDKHLEGGMDAVFLFAYAIGLYLSGMTGDHFSAVNLQFVGLIGTGIVVSIFGASIPIFNISDSLHFYFLFLWVINGLIQSLGWPTAVKLMGNWFGGSHSGFIFGIWSANACVGNIIGAGMVTIANRCGLGVDWYFFLPSINIAVVGCLIWLFVKENPSQLYSDADDDDDNRHSSQPYHIVGATTGDDGKKHYSVSSAVEDSDSDSLLQNISANHNLYSISTNNHNNETSTMVHRTNHTVPQSTSLTVNVQQPQPLPQPHSLTLGATDQLISSQTHTQTQIVLLKGDKNLNAQTPSPTANDDNDDNKHQSTKPMHRRHIQAVSSGFIYEISSPSVNNESSLISLDQSLGTETDNNPNRYTMKSVSVSDADNLANVRPLTPTSPKMDSRDEERYLLIASEKDKKISQKTEKKLLKKVLKPKRKRVRTKRRISVKEAILIPNVMTYAICYACLKSVNYAMFFWLPYFLSDTFSDNMADNLSMVYNVGQIFGGWICGWISDRIAKRSPPVFVFLCFAIVPIFLFRIQSSSVVYCGTLSALAGFFIGGPANIISSAISADLGKHESVRGNAEALSTVAGIIDGTASFGAAITQYAVALISDGGWEWVFVLLTILLFCSAMLIIRLFITEMRYLCKHGLPTRITRIALPD